MTASRSDRDERTGRASADAPRRVAVVTGTRAEFGLLRPVMRAVDARDDLELLVIAGGAHLISPGLTFREVKAEFAVADTVPMQVAGRVGRAADVEALGRGITRFGRSFSALQPEWVVVLGDRIEAFAAACAASVGGFALAHIHGGDRAEGVADEAMRHAITKLAHLHLPATARSAQRIGKMGEDQEFVRIVGSPAIDGLAAVEPIGDDRWRDLGKPKVVLAMHPIGRADEVEEMGCTRALGAVDGLRVLALHPNHDPGRDGIMRALLEAGAHVKLVRHLPRDEFAALLRRLGASGGVLIGNSSAGLIEAVALACPSVDIGQRQGGRERCERITAWAAEDLDAIRGAIEQVRGLGGETVDHPFGDGHAGQRIAAVLAEVDPHSEGLTRKRCVY